MIRLSIALAMVAGVVLGAGCSQRKEKSVSDGEAVSGNNVMIIDTSMGAVKVELWSHEAPKTVANFLRYVDEGFYDGVIFHRVIDGFMIQGGGFDSAMQQRQAHEQIANEANPELRNRRGTIAMARTSDPHSASAQFFINLVDNPFLDQTAKTQQGYGYCAFGEVVEGIDVVDRIGKVPTTTVSGYKDVPAEPVVINSIRKAD